LLETITNPKIKIEFLKSDDNQTLGVKASVKGVNQLVFTKI